MREIDNDWQHLSDPVKTILERIDLNRRSAVIQIGSIVDIPYFKGEMTADIANEIINYQHSKDNQGYFSATIKNDILKINLLKQAF